MANTLPNDQTASNQAHATVQAKQTALDNSRSATHQTNVSNAARVLAHYDTDLVVFLNGPDVKTLEETFLQELTAALTPVLPQLHQAQEDYANRVNALPSVQAFNAAVAQSEATLAAIDTSAADIIVRKNTLQSQVDRLRKLLASPTGVTDLNGDGQADLVWRHSSTGQVFVWLMNGATIQSSGSPSTVSDLGWQIQ